MEPISVAWLNSLTTTRDGGRWFIPEPKGELSLQAGISADGLFYVVAATLFRPANHKGYPETFPAGVELRDRQHLRDIYRAVFGVPLKEC